MPGLTGEKLVVIKRNIQGEETWRYEGVVIRRSQQAVLIEAYFNREDIAFHGIVMGMGDRFIEAYFTGYWFNIFEFHDRDTDEIKGWYSNVTRPAVIHDQRIEYVDLALDLLVYPDGKTLLLDEDEFTALDLDEGERRKALASAAELEDIFRKYPGWRIDDLFAVLIKKQVSRLERQKK